MFSSEVTYPQAGLNVRFQLWDDSGSTPVALGSPVAALNFFIHTYRAKFALPDPSLSYLITKAVYLMDNTTVDTTYPQGSEAVNPSAGDAATIAAAVVDQTLSGHTNAGTVGQALSKNVSSGNSESTLMGVVASEENLVGVVAPDTALIGKVQEDGSI